MEKYVLREQIGGLKMEKWDKREWVATICFLIIFPPIGIAALWRKWEGLRVWH